MRVLTTVFLDIDGTLTDGKVYYLSSGDEMKAFNVKDGLIIATMVKMGYRFVVATGRNSIIVARRFNELGVSEIYQGITDKKDFVKKYKIKEGLSKEECCYIGDDLNDLAAMEEAYYKGCPNDACAQVKKICNIVSDCNGGNGAVRQILEDVLVKNDEVEKFLSMYKG